MGCSIYSEPRGRSPFEPPVEALSEPDPCARGETVELPDSKRCAGGGSCELLESERLASGGP